MNPTIRSSQALRLWLSTTVRASPARTLVLAGFAILTALLAPVSVVGLRMSVDAISAHTSIAPGLAVAIISLLIGNALNTLSGPLTETLNDHVQRYVYRSLMDITAGIPTIGHHEDPDMADRVSLVTRDAYELGQGVTRLLTAIRSAAGVITIAVLLWSIAAWTVLLLPASLAAALVYARGLQQREMHFREGERHRRLGNDLTELLTTAAGGLEVKCFGIADDLKRAAATALRRYSIPRYTVTLRYAGYAAITTTLFWALYGVAVIVVATQIGRGHYQAGDLALLLLLAPQITSIGQSMTSAATTLADGLRFYTRYAWLHAYADAQQTEGQPSPSSLSDGIHLVDLTFAYPSRSDSPTLHDLNLTIPAGTVVCLVGRNGAGKSTLVNLLARLYEPTDGGILLDHTNMADIAPAAWREATSAGFQDFARFELEVADSVGVGDLTKLRDLDAVGTAIRRAQAKDFVDRLPLGLHTQLGTRFAAGTDLSGGQWQRLALARAFMRTEPILMLLDEPTAALDPDGERAIYTEYTAAARRIADANGGITILVSHRFSTARMADLILVMQDGTITESGTHEDLLAAGGHYADMFTMQAASYR